MYSTHLDAMAARRVQAREDDSSRRSVPFFAWSRAADQHWMRANLPVVAEIAAALVAGSCAVYDPYTSITAGQNRNTGLPAARVAIWKNHEIYRELGMPFAEVKVSLVGTSRGRLQGSSISVECARAEEDSKAVDLALDRLARVFDMKKPEFEAYVRAFFDTRAKGIERKGRARY